MRPQENRKAAFVEAFSSSLTSTSVGVGPGAPYFAHLPRPIFLSGEGIGHRFLEHKQRGHRFRWPLPYCSPTIAGRSGAGWSTCAHRTSTF
jgi:hypothetical protein